MPSACGPLRKLRHARVDQVMPLGEGGPKGCMQGGYCISCQHFMDTRSCIRLSEPWLAKTLAFESELRRSSATRFKLRASRSNGRHLTSCESSCVILPTLIPRVGKQVSS
jgi:hypothetical protein